MIIFLYGPDTFRSEEKLNEIIARYKETQKTGVDFSYFNKDENSFDEFKNAAGTVSMFDVKKLIVAKDFIYSKDFSEKFTSWDGKKQLAQSKDAVCVFIDEKIDKKSKIYKWLISSRGGSVSGGKNAQVQEFKLLEPPILLRWARKRAVSIGLDIESSALARLIYYTGPDLWMLRNELDKLRAYKEDGVTNYDLDIFLKPKLQSHIFSFLDAVAAGDAPKAFKFLRGHLEAGDSALYIFSMLHHQFRNIAKVQHFLDTGAAASSISKETNLHPFVVKKSISFANIMGREGIKKIYSRVAEMDRSIKTGEADAEGALETLILRA